MAYIAPVDPNQKQQPLPGQTPRPTSPYPTNQPVQNNLTPAPVAQPAGVDPRPASTTPAPVTPQPAGQGYTPAQFQQWAQTTFGRQATPEQLQQIATAVGPPAGPGGQYSQQQFAQAQQVAEQIARSMGWQGAIPGQPGPDPFQQANIPAGPQTPELAPVQANPLQQQLQSQLSGIMGQQPGDFSQDPIFKAQQDAFNVSSQRGADRQRAQLAEAAGAQGGTLSRGALNSVLERQGERESGFTADLAGRRLEQQQQQIQQAMDLAARVGDQDTYRQLQERAQALAAAGLDQSGFGQRLGALMNQRGLDLQGSLGRGDLDLRRLLGLGQLQLGNKSIDVQNNQANNRLGFDYTQLQALMNRSAIMDILGGL